MKSEKAVRWHYLDVPAAYNRDDLPVTGGGAIDLDAVEDLLAHPHRWDFLSERDTEEVLMELWVQRRRMQ